MKFLVLSNKLCKPPSCQGGWLTLVLLISLWSSHPRLWAQALLQESAKEYQIKAVYLYNFSFFMTWKKGEFAENPHAPFLYCVLGENPFDTQLDLAIRNEKISGRPIQTKYLTQVEQSQTCQVIFISKSEQAKLQTILGYLKKYPILTVSDIPDFLEQGGMVKFYTNSRRQVRVAIDLVSLRNAELTVSAKLLRVSDVIDR